MGFKFLKLNTGGNISSNSLLKKNQSNNKYNKILNNLLDVKPSDPALLLKLSKNNLCLFSLLKKEDLNTIYRNPYFKIKIPRMLGTDVVNLLNKINYVHEIIQYQDELCLTNSLIAKWKLNPQLPLRDHQNWDLIKQEILENANQKITYFSRQWSQYVKNVNDIYIQTNIWPLYIGTYFIQFKIENKSIYSPLVLKEVEIIFDDKNDFYIVSRNSSAILNEKLSYIFEYSRNDIIPEVNDSDSSLEDVVGEINQYLVEKKIVAAWDANKKFFLDKFKKNNANDIDNADVKIMPGIVLSVFNPIGSALRKAVINLIAKNKLNDDLISSKNDYFVNNDGEIVNKILDQKASIFRICPTDISQEKAILACLEDSAIIIGPPGTGKSQVIANILANILVNNKKALFISQKKVALEVVLERMKKLKYFMLQLVENTSSIVKSSKEHFYNNLKAFLELITDSENDFDFDGQTNRKCLISNKLFSYWKGKEELSKNNVSENDLDLFYELKSKLNNFNLNLLNFIYENRFKFSEIKEYDWDFYQKLSDLLGERLSAEFITDMLNNQQLLIRLRLNEIFSFFQLEKSFKNELGIDFLIFLSNFRNKFVKVNYEIIDNFWDFFHKISDFDNTEIILKKFNNAFLWFDQYKKLDCVEKMVDFIPRIKKKEFIKKFVEKGDRSLFSLAYRKEIKVLWSCYLLILETIESYQLTVNFVKDLYKKNHLISFWIENIDFLKQIRNFDILRENWDLIRENVHNLDGWIEFFGLIQIIKKYDLNQEILTFLQDNLSSLKWLPTNLVFLNSLKKYLFSYESFQLINKISNFQAITAILNLYDKFNIERVPTMDEFESAENDILKILVKKFKDEYKKFSADVQRRMRSLKGKIEHAVASPIKLIYAYKDIFPKLFNVVVSTPEALATYVDFENDEYDYVIFDEASQIFLEKAIPFLPIGKKIIIAGDDKQMQPSNWFGIRSESNTGELEVDEDIDSLLDYGVNLGMRQHLLELNYRSQFANLITFSSKHFYESKLKALDENANKSLLNPIEVINVVGEWKNQVNEVEVEKMVEILKENNQKYEKIILLTLNAPQCALLNDYLAQHEPQIYKNDVLINRSLILKNLENIQGDEADLVIISTCYTKDAALSLTYVGRSSGKNALNVAITRAKSKMIVIKSINSSEIVSQNPDVLLFKQWLAFLELNSSEQRSYSIPSNNLKSELIKAESSFEQDVINWLSKQTFVYPFNILSQYEVGSYRIDIALVHPQTNKFLLGIEVDGWKYHSSWSKRYNDFMRQEYIESKGYKLMRIPEIRWKTNKFSIKNDITKKLQEHYSGVEEK